MFIHLKHHFICLARCPKGYWLAAGIILLLLGQTYAYAGKLYYRYVNAQGVTVLDDEIPAQFISAGYSVLTASGHVIKVVLPAQSKEAIAKTAAKKAEDERQAHLQAEQRNHDAVLLRTFTSLEDITRARDNKLKALDNIIEITRGNIQHLSDQLKRLRSEAADFERRGEKLTEFYPRVIAQTTRQIEDNKAFIRTKEHEKQAITITSMANYNRFRVLTRLNEKQKNAEQQALDDNAHKALCKSVSTCNRAWSLAQIFVQEHATTEIRLVTASLVASAPPERIDDLSLSVAREPLTNNTAELILGVHCHTSSEGDSLCKSERVATLRKQFIEEIQSVSQKN